MSTRNKGCARSRGRGGRPAKSKTSTRKSNEENLPNNVTEAETSVKDEGKSLNLDEAICPICLEIKIKPVTMPCSHELCFDCFENNVQKSNLVCPMCRKRISVWSRRAHKSNSLVNEKRWQEIQASFPDLVTAQLEGRNNIQLVSEITAAATHQFAEPGEIRKEYEAELERLQREEQERILQEERASAELIARLHEEETTVVVQTQESCARDEAIARELAVLDRPATRRPVNNAGTSGSTPSEPKRPRKNSTENERNMYFYLSQKSSPSQKPGTSSGAVAENVECDINKNKEEPKNSSAACAGLDDSPRHFRPILAAPLTPSKRGLGEALEKPEAARNLFPGPTHTEEDQNVGELAIDDLDGISPEVLEAQRELEKRLEQERADREMALLLQKQLAQEERAALVSRAKGSGNEYSFRRKSNANQPTLQETLKRRQRKSN